MIDGSATTHWLTVIDEDGEPYGETCRCEIDKDHDEDGSLNGLLPEDRVQG